MTVNSSKRKIIAQRQFKNWDPGGMHKSTRQKNDGKACGDQQNKVWKLG